MTKLNPTTPAAAKTPRAKAAKPKPVAELVATHDDDLAELVSSYCEPIPAASMVKVVPEWANREILDALDVDDLGARSVGLGAAVGIVVAGAAAVEGAGMMARGIARLFR